MDLNEQLRRIRELADRFIENLGSDTTYFERPDPDDVLELATKIRDLDKVIIESGMLPYEWDENQLPPVTQHSRNQLNQYHNK